MWHDDTLALYFSRESHMLARILRLNILKEHKYFDKKKKQQQQLWNIHVKSDS